MNDQLCGASSGGPASGTDRPAARRFSCMRRVLVPAMVVAAFLSASPAYASCAGPASVERDLVQSDLVFVGTVVRLANQNRWATFVVEDVWMGNPDTQVLEVRAGPAVGGSSIERTYQAGGRYLVFAFDATKGAAGESLYGSDRWADSNCSSTQPYTSDLTRYRPASATGGASPTSVGIPSSSVVEGGRIDPLVLLALAGTAAALVFVVLAIRRRNRRVPDRSLLGRVE